MKFIFSFLFFSLIGGSAMSQTVSADSVKKMIIAEASCGQCKFGLPGSGCSLAVRIDGQAYFVDGTSIDQHGDAHAVDGFCNAIRKAELQGEVVDKRFKATYFKLLD
ncbi:MAG: DUF6370 family protein [Bacteroidota bacterium]